MSIHSFINPDDKKLSDGHVLPILSEMQILEMNIFFEFRLDFDFATESYAVVNEETLSFEWWKLEY